MALTSFENHPLGRAIPPDWRHVERYGLAISGPTAPVEVVLSLPRYRAVYDQGSEGACVGYGSSWMMSLLNRRRYDPRWLWDRAKEVDEWPDTNPGDNQGTSVRAACDVLRATGHVRYFHGGDLAPSLEEGILENRWATTVDQLRACLADDVPVAIGVNWYRAFDVPVRVGREWWVGRDGALGQVRGGHCVCVYGASDRRQAFKVVNNWGLAYPLVWLPYPVMGRLLAEDGEATLVTDRP
jgi:hypothetical protein